jgi:nicotinate-nucleotide adenylyltransferase
VNAAVFGGSFDPPHVGHVLAVAYVLATQDVDDVIVVPCFRHPFAKELTSFEHRFAMCELAMGWIPRTRVSRVEEQLGSDSVTLRTLLHLRESRPGCGLRLVVGADVLLEAPRWTEFERVKQLAPLIVLGRAGVTAQGAPPAVLPEISSTAIRSAIREGCRDRISPLVSREVLTYVVEHGLYASAPRRTGDR